MGGEREKEREEKKWLERELKKRMKKNVALHIYQSCSFLKILLQ